MDKELRISITPGTVVTALIVFAGAYALWYLRDLVLLILTAIVLASAIRPGILFFMGYKLPRVLAVLLMYLIVFGTLFSIFYFFIPPVIAETAHFLSNLPQYLETIDVPFTTTSTSELFSSTS